MTQTQVAEKTNYALATVSSYETATAIPSADFAKRADKVFGTDCGGTEPGDLERLQAMVEYISVRRWFRDRVEVERKALEIREYEAHQIPGLLQTESYARAVMGAPLRLSTWRISGLPAIFVNVTRCNGAGETRR